MTETYPNAPLVELIAEVQWLVRGSTGAPQPIELDASMFERFANGVEDLGFTHSERLIPDGFPVFPGQIAWRFRKRRDQPPIYQIGAGIFSANGLPPTYSNWDGFSPFLFEGLEVLNGARQEPSEPYASVKLRYIDAFGPQFLRGRTPRDFIEQELGFSVAIPQVMSHVASTGVSPKLGLQLSTRVPNGGELSVSVGEALVEGRESVVMDIAVQYSGVRHEDARRRFDEAHGITHAVFEGTTRTLLDVLRGDAV